MALQHDFIVKTNLSLNGAITRVNGQPPANGQMLIGSASGFSVATLLGTNGITVSNGPGSVELSMTNTGVAAGTYNSVTVDSTGRVIDADRTAAFSGNIAMTLGTTTITNTTTAPTTSNGTLLATQVVTPVSTTSRMKIEFAGIVDSTVSNALVVLAVFRNSTFIGCSVVGGRVSGVLTSFTATSPMVLQFIDTPNTTSPVTYTFRIGLSTAGTWYLGRTVNNTYGGNNPSGWSITELLT